jgi:hypothetical protein
VEYSTGFGLHLTNFRNEYDQESAGLFSVSTQIETRGGNQKLRFENLDVPEAFQPYIWQRGDNLRLNFDCN